MSLQGVPYEPSTRQLRETMLYPVAEELGMLPSTSGVPDANDYLRISDDATGRVTYQLYANCKEHNSSRPRVAFYAAYRMGVNRLEYALRRLHIQFLGILVFLQLAMMKYVPGPSIMVIVH